MLGRGARWWRGGSSRCCWGGGCSRTRAFCLLSVSRVWSLTPLPSVYTLATTRRSWSAPPVHRQHDPLRGLAALLDVALGAVIAWLLLRGRVRGRQWLDTVATVPLAIPAWWIAVGYLRAFGGLRVPGLGEPLTSTWLIWSSSTRCGGSYAVREAYAALQLLSPRWRGGPEPRGQPGADRFRRITLPLRNPALERLHRHDTALDPHICWCRHERRLVASCSAVPGP